MLTFPAAGNVVVNSGTTGPARNVSLSGNFTQFPGTTTLVTGTVTNNANWILLSGTSVIAISGAQADNPGKRDHFHEWCVDLAVRQGTEPRPAC